MPTHIHALHPRATLSVVFASFGLAIGALAGSIPAIMRNSGIDAETMGLGLTLSTVMTVSAMSLGGQIAKFATNRAVLLAVLPFFAVILFAWLTAHSPLWFFLAIIPMGLAFGLTDLFMNAEAVAVEHDMKKPVFMAFHGAVSCGVALMAILSSFLSEVAGTWATGLFAGAGFALAWILVYTHITPRPVTAQQSAGLKALPQKLPLMLLGTGAGLIIAGETSALMWSAKLLDELAPSLAAITGLGAAFFGLCNAAVRFPGDFLRSHLGDMPLMIGSLLLSIAGFTALGFTLSFTASVIAFATVGLGLGLLIPCIFAMAARFVPQNRAGALSFVSLLTAVPRILAPWFFGFIAAGFGMGAAFGLVAVGLFAALIFILILNRGGTRR